MNMKKLAIVSSHPIQYNAPLFRQLSGEQDIAIKVFYTWEQSQAGKKFDPDFGKDIEWDIPLLEGYAYQFVKNISTDPGTHHFKGLVNPTLNQEIDAWHPDALLVFGWSFDSHLKCLRHFHGKLPIYFRGDSTLLDERAGIKRQLRRWFLKWVYRHIDAALFVGQHNKEYFLKHGLRDAQLVRAPHAVDNRRFEVGEGRDDYPGRAAQWRKELGISENDLVVLFAGKLEPKKDPFFLLELASRVSDPRLRILMVGNGVLEADLKKSAAEDHRILFLDFQNQRMMPVVYRLADVFVLPSRGPGETWGLAVNEAMACGRAVGMSSKAGGAVDLVEEGANGIIFHPGDVEKCGIWIESLLEDRRSLAGMQQRSQKIIEGFTYEQIADAIRQLMITV
jgi:glycosyltransferase involved in cell wall biosynthesis